MKLAPICQGSHFPYLWKKEDVALHGHIPGAAYKSHAALDSLSFYLQVLVTNFRICSKPPGPCLPTATHPPFSLLFSSPGLSLLLSRHHPLFLSCVLSPGHDQSTSVSALDSSRHLCLFSLIATVKKHNHTME